MDSSKSNDNHTHIHNIYEIRDWIYILRFVFPRKKGGTCGTWHTHMESFDDAEPGPFFSSS